MPDHVDYLEAKRTVDERSRSRHVLERLLAAVPPAPAVFEAGCGVGTMPALLSEWGLAGFTYLGVDTEAAAVERARERTTVGGDVTVDADDATDADATVDADDATDADATPTPGDDAGHDSSGAVDVRFERADALEAVATVEPDLVVAQQFVDLVALEPALDAFLGALAPGGLAYFPLTFDGLTVFDPPHPADDRVLEAYHASMDDRPGGGSRAGRRLLAALRARPGEVLAVDAADAVVYPHDDGTYPAREATVLEGILEFFEAELAAAGVPDADEWLRTRRRQLETGDLVYVAHRYDLLYRTPRA